MAHMNLDSKVSEKAKEIKGEVMKKREGKGKAPTYSEIFDMAIVLAGEGKIVDAFVIPPPRDELKGAVSKGEEGGKEKRENERKTR